MKHVILAENLINECQQVKEKVYIISRSTDDESIKFQCAVEIQLLNVIMMYVQNLIYNMGGSLWQTYQQRNLL